MGDGRLKMRTWTEGKGFGYGGWKLDGRRLEDVIENVQMLTI